MAFVVSSNVKNNPRVKCTNSARICWNGGLLFSLTFHMSRAFVTIKRQTGAVPLYNNSDTMDLIQHLGSFTPRSMQRSSELPVRDCGGERPSNVKLLFTMWSLKKINKSWRPCNAHARRHMTAHAFFLQTRTKQKKIWHDTTDVPEWWQVTRLRVFRAYFKLGKTDCLLIKTICCCS